MYISKTIVAGLGICVALFSSGCDTQTLSGAKISVAPINRQQVIERHNPVVREINPQAALTLGNGKFAFTADVTGLQSLSQRYFQHGVPLETKARWAWHSRQNLQQYRLEDTLEFYEAYSDVVGLPTQENSAAALWLRQNPHDLPLARIGFILDEKSLEENPPGNIRQSLNLWRGHLQSQFNLDGRAVAVETVVDSALDKLAVNVVSPLLAVNRLAVAIQFPRGYDLTINNMPDMLWDADTEHSSHLIHRGQSSAIFRRVVDDAEYFVHISWHGDAQLIQHTEHEYRLLTQMDVDHLDFAITFSPIAVADFPHELFTEIAERAATSWNFFWYQGASVDFAGSTNPRAHELERRIILSRYILAAQARGEMPAQETGLTSSSWYGKHHTDTVWWHSAHWALWGQPQELKKVLDWYASHLSVAKSVAQNRGLAGARWTSMVGPDHRESPGENSLTIWNQPQLIHLAELLYQRTSERSVLMQYAELVEETAAAMIAMLVWDEEHQVYALAAPIRSAQQIYDPLLTRNPTFELAYWREGLRIAQLWRQRLGYKANADWREKILKLAPLPQSGGRYVSIESVPDTFENAASRQGHPTMLAAYGLLNDPTIDTKVMQSTLDAVLANWDWSARMSGWDYPMIAMTASRLLRPQTAVDMLMVDSAHNTYLPNGHCPQQGASLPAYLPANGALLAAVAMMIAGWDGAPNRAFPGFPNDGTWQIRAEGFMVFP